jgi:acyl-CoA thioester hydrolase
LSFKLPEFYYEKYVQFHETDLMGIAHHANHLKWFEETRMSWLIEKNLLGLHSPNIDFTLAVLESAVSYKKPCFLSEKIKVFLHIYVDGLKFWFNYGIYSGNTLRATGHTLHIGVDKNLKVKKPPEGLLENLENTKWTETWPLNL